jgi:hypothetical protein
MATPDAMLDGLAKRLELEKRRPLSRPSPLGGARHGRDHGGHVVAVDRLAGHPVPDGAV